MGYEDLIRGGVKLASGQFESMKLDVVHDAWIGEDGDGADEFAPSVVRRALVNLRKTIFATRDGQLVTTFASIIFLDPVPPTTPNPGKTREQPIDPRDTLTLPDGGTAPIVDTGGFADSATAQPFVLKVILGSGATK